MDRARALIALKRETVVPRFGVDATTTTRLTSLHWLIEARVKMSTTCALGPCLVLASWLPVDLAFVKVEICVQYLGQHHHSLEPGVAGLLESPETRRPYPRSCRRHWSRVEVRASSDLGPIDEGSWATG